MSFFRKLIISLLCFSLFTLQLHTPIVEFNSQKKYQVRVGFNDAQATNLGFTKISEDGFPMGYIQLLVMLGVGLMSIALIRNAKRLSPDSVLVAAGAAVVAYDVYNLYTEYAKSELPLKIADGAVKIWNKLFGYHLIFPRGKENQNFYAELFDFLNPLPAAHATFISPVAKMASKVGKSAYKEVNKWIFSPVGRMIVFGAIGTFTGVVTQKTLKQISNVKSNLKKLNEIIEKFDEATRKGSRYKEGQSSVLEEVSDIFLSKAYATENSQEAVELPNKLPCVTYSGRTCVSLKSTLKKRTSKLDKYPREFSGIVNRIVATADSVQGRKTVSPQTMNSLKELGMKGAGLLKLQKDVFKEVNSFRQKNGVKKIDFERKGNEFFGRVGTDVSIALKSSKLNGKELLSGLGMNSYGKEFEKTDVPMNFNFEDSDGDLDGDSIKEENSQDTPLIGAIALDAQIVDDEIEQKEVKPNKRKEKSIFDIISSRYMLKYLDLVPD